MSWRERFNSWLKELRSNGGYVKHSDRWYKVTDQGWIRMPVGGDPEW